MTFPPKRAASAEVLSIYRLLNQPVGKSKGFTLPPEGEFIILEAKHQPRKPWGLPQVVLALVLSAVLVTLSYFFILYAAGIHSNSLVIAGILFGQFVGMYGSWIGVQAYSTMKRGQKSFAVDFGLKFKWYDIFIGLGIGGLLFLSQYLVRNIVLTLFPYAAASPSGTPTEFLTNPPLWLTVLFSIVLPVLIAPFFEELFFRGFIMSGVVRFLSRYGANPNLRWMWRYRFIFAALLSSIVFGISHLQNYTSLYGWLTPIQIGVVGFGLAWTAILFKRLGPSILAHVTHNAIVTILALTSAGVILL